MVATFRTDYIEEPDLVFGGLKEEKDPRIGLRYHGPYHYASEPIPSPSQVRIGLIGSSVTVDIGKQVIERLRNAIASSDANKWLYPDYPGFAKDSSIKCDFVTSPNWEAILKEHETKGVVDIADSVNRRIAAAANLFSNKVRAIALEDNKPDVILCVLPFVVEEYCGIFERTTRSQAPRNSTQVERLERLSELKVRSTR